MANEVTLLEQVRTIENPQSQKILNVFALEYTVNALMPYVGLVNGFHYPWTVMDKLPSVSPRDFNSDFVQDFGQSSSYALPWKNYGGKLTIDEALVKGNPLGAQRQKLMQLQALAKSWANHIFKGTGGTQVYGLDLFLSNFFPGQIITAGTSANGDLLTMDMMDQAFRKFQKGPSSAIFCTQAVQNRLTVLSRTNASGQQNIFWAPDQFGNQVLTYNGVPVYTMVDALTSTDILPGTEADNSGSNNLTTSSLYLVNFGADFVHAFTPDVTDIMNVQESPASVNGTNFNYTRITKYAGVVMEQPRSAVRIQYLKDSAT